MNESTSFTGKLSPDELRQIDSACNRFEDQLAADKHPRLEDYLADVPEHMRPVLLAELLVLELEYGQRNDATISHESYNARFPQYEELIRRILDKQDAEFAEVQIDSSQGKSTLTPAAGAQKRQLASAEAIDSIGNYEIVEKISEGAMGVVYKAWQRGFNRLVALKMIRPGIYAHGQELERFQVEAQAIARMHHPNIVQVYEIGTNGNEPYFSMELVEGGDLAHRLQATPQPAKASAQVVADLAGAVQYAHERHIIHRDLKPSNILLGSRGEGLGSREEKILLGSRGEGLGSREEKNNPGRTSVPDSVLPIPSPLIPNVNDFGVPKISDFGLAKQLDAGRQDLTQTEAVLGTPSYMAPEQASGNSKLVSHAVDIYSLGAILYEMLTGRAPFKGATVTDTLIQLRNQEPVPPRQLNPAAPRDLETICLKCLHKEPQRRYASARELQQDLQRFVRGEPVAARPVTSLERAWRWCRRNPRVAGMAATIAMLLVAVAAGSLIAASIFLQQRNDFQHQFQRANSAEKTSRGHADAAKKAEMKSRAKTAEALYEKAHGYRISNQMGRRFVALDALTEASKLLLTLDLPNTELDARLLKHRNEAIACLALADFKIAKEWRCKSLGQKRDLYESDFDPQLSRFARGEDDGSVTIWQVADNTLLQRLPQPGGNPRRTRFSDDGKLLAVVHEGGKGPALSIWNLESQVVHLQSPIQADYHSLNFSPDSHLFAMVTEPGIVHIFDIRAKKMMTTLKGTRDPNAAVFSPDGKYLAVTGQNGDVRIWDWREKSLYHRFETRNILTGADWSPDQTHFAAGCENGDVLIWDVKHKRQIMTLKAHRHHVHHVRFHPGGRHLVTTSWDHTTRLWDLAIGQEVLKTNNLFIRFRADGKQLGFFNYPNYGVWDVNMAEECRFLCDLDKTAMERGKCHVVASACSPDGNWIATGDSHGLRIWNRNTGEQLSSREFGSETHVVFHPRKSSLLTANGLGLYEWPIHSSSNENQNSVVIGPPKLITKSLIWPHRIALSADGSKISMWPSTNQAIVLQPETKKATRFPAPNRANFQFLSISPNGEWLALTEVSPPQVKIWDLTTRRRVKTIPVIKDAGVAFSPDGKWLAVSDNNEDRLWHAGTWKKGPLLSSEQLGHPCFSRSGDMLAIGAIFAPRQSNAVRLYSPGNGGLLAKLENTPAPSQILDTMSFSPDGRHLIVPHFKDNFFAVWDLHRIRRQLRKMKLDWDTAPIPQSQSAEPKPLTVEIRFGATLVAKHVKARRWREAVTEATMELAHTPDNVELLHLRGQSYWKLRQYEKALTDLNKALKLNENHIEAHHHRGHVYHALKQYDKGAADFAAASKGNPKNAHFLDYLAECHFRLQKHAQAAEAWEQSFAINAEQPYPCYYLAWIYTFGPKELRKPKEALTRADRACKLNSKNVSWQQLLGVAQYRAGQLQNARDTLKKVDAKFKTGSYFIHHFYLAMVYHKLGQAPQAKKHYNLAMEWKTAKKKRTAEQIRLFTESRSEADRVMDRPAEVNPSR